MPSLLAFPSVLYATTFHQLPEEHILLLLLPQLELFCSYLQQMGAPLKITLLKERSI